MTCHHCGGSLGTKGLRKLAWGHASHVACSMEAAAAAHGRDVSAGIWAEEYEWACAKRAEQLKEG